MSTPVSIVAKFSGVNEERRVAYYVASQVTDAAGAPLVDHQLDMISEDELERAAHRFYGSGAVGEMHSRTGVGVPVASLVLTKALQAALSAIPGASPVSVPVVWVVGFRFDDDAMWSRVKAGEFPETSIGGRAVRSEVTE